MKTTSQTYLNCLVLGTCATLFTGCGSGIGSPGAGAPPADSSPDSTQPTIHAIASDSEYQLSLPPSGEVWMGMQGQAGDNLIADAVPGSKNDDVRIELCRPGGSAMADSSAPAGCPQNVWLELPYSGELHIRACNRSSSIAATPHIIVQRISASTASKLNGVYRITRIDGQSPGAVERWIFNDGRLVSRYVAFDLRTLGGQGTFQQWYEHRVGRQGRIYVADSLMTYVTTQNTTAVNGSSVTFSYTVDARWSGDLSSTMHGTASFSGTISSSGTSLSGTVSGQMNIDGQPVSYSSQVTLTRE